MLIMMYYEMIINELGVGVGVGVGSSLEGGGGGGSEREKVAAPMSISRAGQAGLFYR